MGRQPSGQSESKPIDKNKFPNVEAFLHRPLLCEPPMCSLHQLQDGTYSIEDVALMNELLDLKLSMSPKPKGKR